MIDRQDSDSLFGLASMPGHLIRRSQQIATALFAEEVGELDLTPVQFAVLMVVVDRPRIEAARISDLIAFDRSTLADVLDRLARRKLIERTVSLTDKRAKAVVATPEGIALFERALPAVRRVQQGRNGRQVELVVRLLEDGAQLLHRIGNPRLYLGIELRAAPRCVPSDRAAFRPHG